MKYFPDLIAQNLNSRKGTFPQEFREDWNIVLTGFLMEHQQSIESWIPHVENWENTLDSCTYYEMPVLPAFDFTSRASIHLSMRWYIDDVLRRERTYLSFTDVGKFLRNTGTPSQVQSRIMLIDKKGNIHINAPGAASSNLIELFNRKFGLIDREIWSPDTPNQNK